MYSVGLDIGYSNMTVVHGHTRGEYKQVSVPSGAGPESCVCKRVSGESVRSGYNVKVEGEEWVAGIRQDLLDGYKRELSADYPKTKPYQALYKGALACTEHDVIDCLVTGLPVNQTAQKKSELVSVLRGRHQVGGREIHVKDVRVVPQPAGSFLDLMDVYKEKSMLASSRVLVIDVGFFSCDWLLMDAGIYKQTASGTSAHAMSALLEEADRHIGSDEMSYGIARLETAIRKNATTIYQVGKPIQLRDITNKAAMLVGELAMSEIKNTLRKESAVIDVIVLTGGGADFYKPSASKTFPEAHFIHLENSVNRNALGFYKYAAA